MPLKKENVREGYNESNRNDINQGKNQKHPASESFSQQAKKPLTKPQNKGKKG